MDRELVDQARRGDSEAFRALLEPVYDRCYGVACRILGQTAAAQDATQQALLAIWQQLPQLRDTSRFEPWCYRIVVHACYAETRRSRRAIPGLLGSEREPASPGDDFARILTRDQLERAFARLPVEQRAAVVLRFWLDMPLEAMAAALDIPLGTVKSRLHGALAAMRAALDADLRPPADHDPGARTLALDPTTRWTA